LIDTLSRHSYPIYQLMHLMRTHFHPRLHARVKQVVIIWLHTPVHTHTHTPVHTHTHTHTHRWIDRDTQISTYHSHHKKNSRKGTIDHKHLSLSLSLSLSLYLSLSLFFFSLSIPFSSLLFLRKDHER